MTKKLFCSNFGISQKAISLVQAFVLINTELGKEKEVAEEIKQLPELKELYLLYGVYDMIILVEAETTKELKNALAFKVRKLKKIQATLTMIVV